MNDDFSKLRLQQQHAETTNPLHQAQQQQHSREFASVEEIIRADKEQVEVPSAVAQRLTESIAIEPKPHRPWWKRIFKGS